MNSEFSKVITLLRFPLIVGIVLIHSYSDEILINNDINSSSTLTHFNCYIQNLFSQVFGRVSVPLFFLFSGYLLYREKNITVSLYKEKLSNRIRSLFIPFIFWNLIVLLIQIFGQLAPFTKDFFSGERWDVRAMTLFDYFNAFLGISGSPINYPLWFLRDLILLIILSPILKILINKFSYIFLSLLFAIWLNLMHIEFFISKQAVLFFCAGLLMANQSKLIFPRKNIAILIFIFYLLIAFIEAYFKTILNENLIFNKFNIIFGCYALVILFTQIQAKQKLAHILKILSSASFFIFVAHGSLLEIFKSVLKLIFEPNSQISIMIIYFLSPFLTIAILSIIYFKVIPILPSIIHILMFGIKHSKKS